MNIQLSRIRILAITLFLLGGLGVSNAAANTTSWLVTQADKDPVYGQFGGGHAFVFFGQLGSLNNAAFIFDGGFGILEEDFDAGTAHMTGVLSAIGDSNNKWEVDVWLTSTPRPSEVHKELKPEAYSENGGPIDTLDWRFYLLDDKSILTGLDDNLGASVALTQRGGPFQIGTGANGKNINFGASSWFDYTGSYAGTGDINVDTAPVPEPGTMALLGIGLSGMGFIRRKRQKV